MSTTSSRKSWIYPAAVGIAAALLLTACGADAPKKDSGTTSGVVAAQDNPALFRDIYKELVDIDTSHSTGSTTVAANAMKKRLLDAGFAESDIQIFEPAQRKGNLVLRFAGSGQRKPLLLMAHLDVVEAKREDGWQTDPYKLTEQDGFYVARGTVDDKAMAAAWVADLIALKGEGFRPDRDIVLALTADEEAGDTNGAQWLMANKPDLMTAEYGLNEGGDSILVDGKPAVQTVQVAEKTYAIYTVEAKSKGGHSSIPTPANAIYSLTAGLNRLSGYRFPASVSDATRDYFAGLATKRSGQEADDLRAAAAGNPSPEVLERLSATPEYNAQLRTTCVATMLKAGEAENALPQTAQATVNCRILPQDDPADIERRFRAALADPGLTVTPEISAAGGISPVDGDVMTAVTAVTKDMFPTSAVSSVMSTGATDSSYARAKGIPMYGISGLYMETGDLERQHGVNERAPIAWLDRSRDFLYRLIKRLSQ